MIADVLWYMPNTIVRMDLQSTIVKEEIHHYSTQQSAHLTVHPDDLVVNLMA
jgi:hypothetical protein